MLIVDVSSHFLRVFIDCKLQIGIAAVGIYGDKSIKCDRIISKA